MENHVRQDRDGEGEVVARDLHPIDRHLAVGGGIHHAAYTLNGLADVLGGGPVAGALEGKVLQEV